MHPMIILPLVAVLLIYVGAPHGYWVGAFQYVKTWLGAKFNH